MPFRVASIQFRPSKAQIDTNLDRVSEGIRQARAEGCELAVFPEGAMTGYFLEGGVVDQSRTVAWVIEALAGRLKGLEQSIDFTLGFYEESKGTIYNACGYFCWDGQDLACLAVHRKFFLPTYGVFDEERFVTAGSNFEPFDTRLGRVGILICEDAWHSMSGTLLALQGAEMILVVSASPARGFSTDEPSNLGRWERLISAISDEHGIYCVNSQLVGFEGGKGFVGGGMITSPDGSILERSPIMQEHMLIGTVDLEGVKAARAACPLLPDLHTRWSSLMRIASEIGGPGE